MALPLLPDEYWNPKNETLPRERLRALQFRKLQDLVAWSGQTPTVAPYGTNAWAYGGLARETVVMGPGSIAQAHGAEEWIEISELEKMADIYRRWWRAD